MDFPVKKKETILQYFKDNQGLQFVHFERPIVQEKYLDRLRYHSYFQDSDVKGLKSIDRGIRQLERIAKYDRIKKSTKQFQYGTNWFSITGEFASWVLEHTDWIEKTFKNTRCGDELFIQTMLINSPFSEQVVDCAFDDDYRSCLRFIDWKRGKPYIFRTENFDELVSSPYLFARKFDLRIDSEIIERLYEYLR